MFIASARRTTLLASLLTTLFLLFSAALTSAAVAEQAADGASPQLTLDPDLLNLPAPAAPKTSAAGAEDDADAKLKLPTQFDLGTSQLRLDTDRKAADSIPRVGVEATEPNVIIPGARADDASPLKPNYFGFTLSTPTH
jgi:hypothetical protein